MFKFVRVSLLLGFFLVSVALGEGGGIPELSDAEKKALAGVVDDGGALEGAGIEALIDHAVGWPDTQSGAMIPDYGAIHKTPGEYRGKLFLIRGVLRSLIPGGVQGRPGVVGFKVQVGEDPDAVFFKERDILHVYLTEPFEYEQTALDRIDKSDQKIELVGRFYKRIPRQDGEGNLVFVGRGAKLTGPKDESRRDLIPKLNARQRELLAGVRDDDDRYDEAALNMLLEDADGWASPAPKGGVEPSYDAIWASPSEFRGDAFVIEGKFQTLLDAERMKITNQKWEGVRAVTVLIRPNKSYQETTNRDNVLVFLIEPPRTDRAVLEMHDDLTRQTGSRVRLVGRFYKRLMLPSSSGGRKPYLVFVGQQMFIQGPGQSGGGWNAPLILGVMIVAGGYLFWRIHRVRKAYSGRRTLDEYIRERAEKRRLEGVGGRGREEEEEAPGIPCSASRYLRVDRLEACRRWGPRGIDLHKGASSGSAKASCSSRASGFARL